MEVKAFGTFIKKKDYVYRTNTYLQFGESEDIIGACVLCNPGSSSLKNKKEHEKLVESKAETEYKVNGELKLDSAMRQLKDTLKGIYGETLSGRFMMFNIFTLRNSKMSEAVRCLEDNEMDKELLFIDFENYNTVVAKLPWILIGWGCENKQVLNEQKERWIEFIRQNDIGFLGIEGKKSPHYYHPLPPIHQNQKEYRESIIRQYNNEINKKD